MSHSRERQKTPHVACRLADRSPHRRFCQRDEVNSPCGLPFGGPLDNEDVLRIHHTMKRSPRLNDVPETTPTTTQSPTVPGSRCAAHVPADSASRRLLDAHLAKLGCADAVRYRSEDDDELAAAVLAGEFDCVVFADLADLLTTLWNGDAKIIEWRMEDLRVELADRRGLDGVDPIHLIRAVFPSLHRWRERQRRRQIIAALVLSLIALLAIAVLFFFVPPPA